MQTVLGLLPQFFFMLQKVRLGSSQTPKLEKIDFLAISSLKRTFPPRCMKEFCYCCKENLLNLLDFPTTLALLNGIGRSQTAVESVMTKKKFVAIKSLTFKAWYSLSAKY